jgi:hypothetical protein
MTPRAGSGRICGAGARDKAVDAGVATVEPFPSADAALSIVRVRVSLQEAASAASATAVPPAMIV